MHWLKLVRWKNLAIIFTTQLLAWYCVILPLHPVLLLPANFLLLSLSTVLIAASGYIINDYFDVRIDAINKPDDMVLGKIIPRRIAIIVHFLLNIIAFAMAGLVAYRAHNLFLISVQISCTILLWYYSTMFKREFIIGNVVVSLLTALTILTLVIYEPTMGEIAGLNVFRLKGHDSSLPFWVLMVYAWFAFMLNWIREIVKDMEDFAGDAQDGCKTMPIVKGLKYSTHFITVLTVLVFAPLVFSGIELWTHNHVLFSVYVFMMLVLPVVAWLVHLHRSTGARHYMLSTRGLKLIMLMGIFSLIIYYFQL